MANTRYLREGRRFTEDRYSGQVKADANCWALVERQGSAGAMADAVALDRLGRPRTSLVVAPSEVLSLRYVAPAPGACRLEQLDGLVTSQQQGLALASYAGRQDRATYSGNLKLAASCLGSMTQRDSAGVSYYYKVVLLANGGGYVYLKTDPDNLTLGLLQHQR
jgi:hypothetical protein